MQINRSVLAFSLSTAAFVFLLLVNLSGVKAPFVKNLHFSRIEDEGSMYIWTMYNYCSLSGNDYNGARWCISREAAYPYEPFRWSTGKFAEGTFKNGSRAAYGLILTSLLVNIISNFAGLSSFFKKSNKLFNAHRITSIVALVSIFLGATINTALHSIGTRKISKDGSYTGHMGKTLMTFVWLSVVLQLASVLVAYLWKPEQKPRELEDKEDYSESNSETSSKHSLESSPSQTV